MSSKTSQLSESAKSILCVDDDADSRELMSVVLNGAGYRVVTAADHNEGVRLAKGGGFDAIILDNWFCDGNGPDICREIRANDRRIPIIFYSAAAYPEEIDRAISAGAQAYLVKPNGLEEIVPTLDQLVNATASSAPHGVTAPRKANRRTSATV